MRDKIIEPTLLLDEAVCRNNIRFNIHEVGRINALPGASVINLCAMHRETIVQLQDRLTREVGIYIKIDVGYGRTGLVEDDPQLEQVVDGLDRASKMTFKGFLGHAGHSYYARSKEEIRVIDVQSREMMQRLQERFPGTDISLGDFVYILPVHSCMTADAIKRYTTLDGNLITYLEAG